MARDRVVTGEGSFALALPALVVLLGLQVLRVFLPSVVWVAGARLTVEQMGLTVLATFLAAFLAPLGFRWLGGRGFLALSAGGLGLFRLAEQLVRRGPWDLAASLAATGCFLWFFPAYVGWRRQSGRPVTPLAWGLSLGVAADTALRGVLLTYDLSWRPGVGPWLAVALLAGLLWWGLREEVAGRAGAGTGSPGWPSAPAGPGPPADGPAARLWPLLGIGFHLFLQTVLFQNFGRLAQFTGWSYPAAYGWLSMSNALALAALFWVLGPRPPLALTVTALNLAAIMALRPFPGVASWGAVALVVAHLVATLNMGMVLAAAGRPPVRSGLAWTSVFFGLGMVLFVGIALAFYSRYTVPNVFWLAGLGLGVAGIGAAWLLHGQGPAAGSEVGAAPRPGVAPARGARRAGRAVAALVALGCFGPPLLTALAWRPPAVLAVGATGSTGEPASVRVMTYNLHNGFDAFGTLDLEGLARVIETSDADVVALQEVTRGWLVSGGVDMVTWLERRLGRPVIFGPTAGDSWGNAVLTRFAVARVEVVRYPVRRSPLHRGFIWAEVDTPAGRLNLLATHLDHEPGHSAERQAEVADLLAFWAGRSRTVVLGDLNATPEAAEIRSLVEAGLKDAWAALGDGPGHTFSADNPFERIDYVFVTPDLGVADVGVPRATASDHLPVVVTVLLPR